MNRGKIISDVYLAWSIEQKGKFEVADKYAEADPTAYAEHADLLSSSPEAERDLFERTKAALEAATQTPLPEVE